ncbi:MFS transporter [Streptomyces albidoflavus]|uniref:MFS transporter n=1 Tax=Streptomyces albidoflavus TaxID=1886 RepID=UPI00339FD4E4
MSAYSSVTEEACRPVRRTLFAGCLLVLTAQMATTLHLPSLPAVARDLGVSRSYAGLSVSLFVVGAAAPVLFWGKAADRYGRRAAALAALALFTGAGLLLATELPPAGLLVARCVQGAGAGGAAIVARIFVRDLGGGDALARRLSLLSVAFVAALGGGQFLGGLIGAYAHWRTGFLVLAGLGLGCALAVATLPLEPGRPRPEGHAATGVYLRLLRQPSFLRPTAAGGLGFAVIVLLQEVAPFLYQRQLGVSTEGYGRVGLLLGAAYCAGALLVNRLAASAGARRLMRVGALVMAASGGLTVCLWLLPALPAPATFTVFTVLYGAITFGQAALFPSSMAVAADGARDDSAYAIALGGFLAQSVAGVVAVGAVFLHHNLVWAAVVTGLGCLAWLLVREGAGAGRG